MLADDPWINEGYDSSPIMTDMSTNIDEDETLIKLIEQKFSISPDQIRKSIREEVYDDVSSLYYMMYHEKHKSDNFEQASKVLEGNATNVVREPPPVPPQASDKANKMDKISEDEQANHLTKEEAQKKVGDSTSLGRKRRFTVSGDADVQKMAVEEKDEEALKKLMELRKAVGNDEETTVEQPDQRGERRSTASTYSPFRKSMVEPNPSGNSRRDSVGSQNTSTADDSKPRSLRFTFNSSNTSSKAPEDLIQQLIAACQKLGYNFKLTSRYVVEACPIASLKIEIEVCRLPLLKNLYGLKFRRSSGSGSEYKEACEKILGLLTLQ